MYTQRKSQVQQHQSVHKITNVIKIQKIELLIVKLAKLILINIPIIIHKVPETGSKTGSEHNHICCIQSRSSFGPELGPKYVLVVPLFSLKIKALSLHLQSKWSHSDVG